MSEGKANIRRFTSFPRSKARDGLKKKKKNGGREGKDRVIKKFH